MGAFASVMATAMAQLRNGYISCIVNKNDPYSAIRILSFMLAILPEDARPEITDPPRPDDECELGMTGGFLFDPDNTKASNAVWNYVAEMGYKTEEAVSMYIYGQMSRLRN
jgi:hypothetical protein